MEVFNYKYFFEKKSSFNTFDRVSLGQSSTGKEKNNSADKNAIVDSYNSLTNSVEFTIIPPEGSHVEIGYVIETFAPNAGDDDDSAE